MRLKKCLCLFLSVLLLLTAFPVRKAAAVQSDAYATIVTASDFQGGEDAFPNFGEMLSVIESAGYATPDAFFFGGDYGDDSGVDPTVSTELVMEQVQNVYPNITREKTVFVQGNHDAANPSGEYLTPTGFYEFEDFVVYSINEDSFNARQSSREDYGQIVQALGADVKTKLTQMISNGDTRPVFVITHVPLHHSSRRSYGDTLYSKYLFDVLNDMGKQLDIIFLFGHNHSGTYDDYIGGAVNYLPRGSSIRIPIPDTDRQGIDGYTEETLNFTYMNYGYVGYSNNTASSTSTDTLTTGVFEISPTSIKISRYSKDGLYRTETIKRINSLTKEPYVSISGKESGFVGESGFLSGTVSNFVKPSYSWTSSDPEVASLLSTGTDAQILYKGAGTAQLCLTVTDSDGITVSDRFTVTVAPSSEGTPEAAIYLDAKDVTDSSINYNLVNFGDTLLLKGSFTGYGANASKLFVRWSSSDPDVATVDNGLVTFLADGMTIITFTVSDGVTTLRKTLKLTISQYPKATYVYRLADRLEAGKTYVIASAQTVGDVAVMSGRNIFDSKGKGRMALELAYIRLSGDDITLYADYDCLQWEAVSGEAVNGSDGIFLRGKDGTYLCCTASGLYTTPGTDEESGMLWSLNDDLHLVSDSGYGPHYSSDGNFRTDDAPEECYVYEQIAVMSYTVWSPAENSGNLNQTSGALLPFDFTVSSHLIPEPLLVERAAQNVKFPSALAIWILLWPLLM